jgi:hypothetical protein
MTSKGRLTPQQLRILGVAWMGVVVLVGACTFLGIFFAARAPRAPEDTASDSGNPIGQDLPTANVPAGGSEGAEPQVPPATPLPGPTIPPRQDSSFGYGIQTQAHVNTEQTLDQVQQLGMNWIKQQINWKDLEPVRGQPNWDALDAIFAATSQRNIKVMVSVTDAPDWARSVTGRNGPPDDPQDFVNYMVAMLQRYPGAIHAVEVWNEPNLYERGWYAPGGVNAQGYMDLLIPVAAAIRQTDPGVIVISAALAPTGVNDPTIGIDDFTYNQQLIELGMLDHVDCVGAHSNGLNLPPDTAYDAGFNDPTASFRGPFDNPHHSWSFYSTLTGYHDMIVAAGRSVPLCVTEFGWPSIEGMSGQAPEGFEFAYDNTLEEQADYIVRAYQLMQEWDFVWLAFLFNLDYSPKIGGDPQHDSTMWSITAPDGSPRPAYDAVRDMPKPP